MNFPSCKFVNQRDIKTPFKPSKEIGVIEPHPWQDELSDFCRDGGRYIQVNAPGGCGKTLWAAYNSIVEGVDTDNSRKFLFLAPMTTICNSYSKTLYFNYKDKKRIWKVKYQYGSDPKKSGIKEIKKFLSMKVDPDHTLSASATHAGFVQFWGNLTLKEKKKLLHNVTIYIDECHHCSDETKLGVFVKDVLRINCSTCKIILMTATMFRGDEGEIIPKKSQKKFNAWSLPLEDYMEILQIKGFNFDYIAYDEDPLDLIVENIKKHKNKRHIIVLPDTTQHFRKDKMIHYKYMGRALSLFPQERVLDLVSPKTQDVNKRLLQDYPERFDLVIACKLMAEGTDWPPASILHNTRVGSSLLLSAQISFRLFRKYEGKDEIFNYIYLPSDKFVEKSRTIFANRLIILLLQILMAGYLQPILIPLLPKSPYYKKYKGRSVTLMTVLDMDKKLFDELIGQIIMAHDLEVHEMIPARLIRKRFNKLAESFYKKNKLSKHIDEKEFKNYVLKELFRINRIAKGEKEDIDDKLDVSFIREEGGFDKIWEKENLLGSFVMGTKEPIKKEDMEHLRDIYDKHMELRLQANEVDVDVALERYIVNKEKKKIELKVRVTKTNPKPLKDMVGKWVLFQASKDWKHNNGSAEHYGLVTAQSDVEVVVNFYKGEISIDNEKHLILTTKWRDKKRYHIFCGNYWSPMGFALPPYGVSAKLVKRFFFEHEADLYGGGRLAPKKSLTIPISWINKTITYKGGEL